MSLFRRRKIESPRNPLGLALFKYDNILKKDLKRILGPIDAKKKLNAGKAGLIVENVSSEFDDILEDLPRDKLKVDYRSDKIRYMIIDMINELKNVLKEAKIHDFDLSGIDKINWLPRIAEIKEMRNVIKRKMKDIESDYL